jgi:hypothetical protein
MSQSATRRLGHAFYVGIESLIMQQDFGAREAHLKEGVKAERIEPRLKKVECE